MPAAPGCAPKQRQHCKTCPYSAQDPSNYETVCSKPGRACVVRRFVDPSDPTKVFLTSPVDEAHRAPSAPVYAPNYAATQHERYQPMEPARPPAV